jgi:hypothetical protein
VTGKLEPLPAYIDPPELIVAKDLRRRKVIELYGITFIEDPSLKDSEFIIVPRSIRL